MRNLVFMNAYTLYYKKDLKCNDKKFMLSDKEVDLLPLCSRCSLPRWFESQHSQWVWGTEGCQVLRDDPYSRQPHTHTLICGQQIRSTRMRFCFRHIIAGWCLEVTVGLDLRGCCFGIGWVIQTDSRLESCGQNVAKLNPGKTQSCQLCWWDSREFDLLRWGFCFVFLGFSDLEMLFMQKSYWKTRLCASTSANK